MLKPIKFEEYFKKKLNVCYIRNKKIILKNKDYILILINDIIEKQNRINKPIYMNLSEIREIYLKSNRVVYDFVKQNIIEYRDCQKEFERNDAGKLVFKKMIRYTTVILNQNLCDNPDFMPYNNSDNYDLNNYTLNYEDDNNNIINEIKIRKTKNTKVSLAFVNKDFYEVQLNSFNQISNKDECGISDIFYSHVASNGRNYNNIVQCKKDNRPKILLVDNTKPIEIDVKSAMPWFISQLFLKPLKDKTDFIEKFIYWVENGNKDMDVYKFLLKTIENRNFKTKIDREWIKDDLIIYFTPKKARKKRPVWMDRENFLILEKIRQENNYELAKIYQKKESDIFIKAFRNDGFKFVFSIHDCYMCHFDDKVKILALLNENFMNEFGCVPRFE
jgi:hypothetical protein